MLTLFSQTGFHTRVIEYPDEQPKEIESDSLVQHSIHRLSKAILDEKVKKQLEFEEEMERKVQDLFNTLEDNAKMLEEKDKTIKEKGRTIEELQKKLSLVG